MESSVISKQETYNAHNSFVLQESLNFTASFTLLAEFALFASLSKPTWRKKLLTLMEVFKG
jgi:hypothetical protein